MLSFYTDPAFFIILAVIAIPAVALGALGRSLKGYGMAVSALFLVLLFAGSWEGTAFFALFVALGLATTYVTLALFRRNHPHRIAFYRIALAVMLVPLVAAKLSAVFDANILGFIGISYLTFKAVQVLIEIRDGLIESMTVPDYLYFLAFFPVFTSGPITRSRDFLAQARHTLTRPEYLELLSQGLLWLLRGIMYSFVLAPLGQWFMWFVPEAIGTASASAFVLGQLAYGFGYGMFLFFDFAGYSAMAMGVGAIFGIEVPRNFDAPFRSIDIKDFWNRWHMTLSFWLRDFVFMRMTRSFMKHKVFKSRLTTACCAFVAEMALMGVWHGLTIDYLVYGLYHGCLLALCEVYQKKSRFYKAHKKDRWFRLVTWAITMVAIFFGFAIFSGQISTLLGM